MLLPISSAVLFISLTAHRYLQKPHLPHATGAFANQVASLGSLLIGMMCKSAKKEGRWGSGGNTWVRQISAVAASSMRLSMGTQPSPPSHASRYCTPTQQFVRSVASVLGPCTYSHTNRVSTPPYNSPFQEMQLLLCTRLQKQCKWAKSDSRCSACRA